MQRYVAVVGGGTCSEEEAQAAERIGALLARANAVVVCGGLSGVMEAACRGARREGGLTVGILPGSDRGAANPHVVVAVATGLGELRNGLVVRSRTPSSQLAASLEPCPRSASPSSSASA